MNNSQIESSSIDLRPVVESAVDSAVESAVESALKDCDIGYQVEQAVEQAVENAVEYCDIGFKAEKEVESQVESAVESAMDDCNAVEVMEALLKNKAHLNAIVESHISSVVEAVVKSRVGDFLAVLQSQQPPTTVI